MRYIVLLTHLSDVLGVLAPVPWTQGWRWFLLLLSARHSHCSLSHSAPALSIPVTARGTSRPAILYIV